MPSAAGGTVAPGGPRLLQALVFLGVAFSAVGLIHYYLWRKLVRATTRPGRARRIGTWTVVGVALFVVATFIARGPAAQPVRGAVRLAGLPVAGRHVLPARVLVVLEIPTLIARLVIRRTARAPVPAPEPVMVGAGGSGRRRPKIRRAATSRAPAPPSTPSRPTWSQVVESRRLFLARAVAVTAGVASVGLVGPGVATALGRPGSSGCRSRWPSSPGPSDGIRIAAGQRHPPRPADRRRAHPPHRGPDQRPRRRRGRRSSATWSTASVAELGAGRRAAGRPAQPARRLLRHRQPRVLLRLRAVDRRGGPAGRAAAAQRAASSCPAGSTWPASTT